VTPALSVLNEVIDGNRLPRKVIADEIGVKEATFSKMTGGTQAFGLDDFGNLPRELQIAWIKRYGCEVLGLSVTELSVVDAAVAVMDAFAALQSRMRTLETVKPQMVKADLPASELAKRSA
jgi:hypothetical protein